MVERDKLEIDIKFDATSINTYKLVDNGDYVVHLRSFQGGLAFCDLDGVCSPAYTILKPSDSIEYGYFKEYFMSSRFIDSLRLVTYGIRDGRSISIDEMLSLKICLPTLKRQKDVCKLLSVYSSKILNEEEILKNYQKQKLFLRANMFV